VFAPVRRLFTKKLILYIFLGRHFTAIRAGPDSCEILHSQADPGARRPCQLAKFDVNDVAVKPAYSTARPKIIKK